MSCTSKITSARAALLMALGLLAAGSARADLSGYTVAKLAFEGDTDPVVGTLSQMIGEVDLDEDGRVTFVSFVDDGGDLPLIKILSVESGVLGVEVSEGDVAPDTGGLLFVDVGRPRIAAPGVLGYLGLYDDGGDSRSGAFLRNGGTDSAMALPGTAAPGGGTISMVSHVHTATAAPSVAFGAWVDTGGPSPIAAHFVHETTGLREIYRDGQAAPEAVGGTFSGVQAWWVPALTADGTLTFYADVSGGRVASGLFQASPTGVVTPLLLEGDAVTTPGGGTFTGFFEVVGANGDGDLAIAANVLRPPLTSAPQAVFVLEGDAQREVVFRGDPLPGTNPPRFFRQLGGSGPPALNRAGTTAFVGILTDDLENVSEPALLVRHGGELGVLVKEGDPVPGVPGDTFTDFHGVRIGDDGTIAFYAYTMTGTGVFLATPPLPAAPAVPPVGLALLALALAAAHGCRHRA